MIQFPHRTSFVKHALDILVYKLQMFFASIQDEACIQLEGKGSGLEVVITIRQLRLQKFNFNFTTLLCI